MINLIPPHAKKDVRREYWLRVIGVWLLLWSVFIIVGAFILFPVYVLIGSQIAVYEESAFEASKKVIQYENVSTTLVQASQQARFALDETTTPAFSKYITIFESLEGEEIQINEITLSREGKEIKPVLLSGVATGRQALAAFRDELLALDVVLEVDLPISNLARDKDISFSITVTMDNIKTYE